MKNAPANHAFAPKHSQSKAQAHPFEVIEERYIELMQGSMQQAQQIGEADIVIGIPFYNETDTIGCNVVIVLITRNVHAEGSLTLIL